MSKRKKIAVIFLPLIIIISFFALKFWAQVVIPEYDITFTESFDTTDFKDEEKSSVNHWGDGYITLNLAGIFQQIPAPVNFPIWINMVAYADFDDDGLQDFIGTSDIYCRRIVFVKNYGEGVFDDILPYIYNDSCGESWESQINTLVAGDFDNDGDQDFMYVLSTRGAGYRVSPIDEVWFFEHEGWIDANGIPQFTIRDYSSQLSSGLEGIGWSASHQAIDYDGDGDVDILFANGYGKVVLLLNDGSKPLSDRTKFTTTTLIDAKVGEPGNRWNERGVTSIGIGDFDGDGDVDIIIGSVSWRGLKYYKNDGTGNFTLHEVLGDMTAPYDLGDDYYDGACTSIAVADYDGDGDLDFMVGTDNWNLQETYPPAYEWGNWLPHPGCGGWYNTGTRMGGKAFYFKNDGSGEFSSSLIFDGPQLIAEGECIPWDFDFGLPSDFDGDGDIDYMIFDGNHSEFYYFFENILYNIFNMDGTAVSTNITAQSFPPDGLDPEEYAITKVQFTALDQSVIGADSGLKVTYYVSNNGGRGWELYVEFEEGDIHNYTDLPVHTFSTFGSDLRWKAEMSAPNDYPDSESKFYGTSTDTPRIERIEIKSTYVGRQEYSRTSVVVTNVVDENDQQKRYLLASTFYYPGWDAHLRAYDISAMTPESTSYSVLRTVSRPDLTQPSGRKIPDGVNANIAWDAGELLDARSAASRIVYTATPVDSVLARIDFTASNVATLGPIILDVNNDNEGLINYIKGEGRDWKLGDSNHSNPIVVGPPSESAVQMGDGYQEFMNTWVDRRKVVYVGANDGMLHCFDVLTGDELWGFIPYNLLPKLKNMWAVNPDTGERYFLRDVYVDGSPVVADVYIDADGDRSQEWTTILICGQGPGNGSTIGGGTNYYFALNITDPDDPWPLWEFTDDYLGETWSVPVVGKIRKNGEDAWFVFMGSGYDDNPSVGNVFYAVDTETGEYFWAFSAGEVDTTGESGWGEFSNIPNSIPGSPSIIDIGQDGHADCVYFADLDGRVWKVDVSIEYQDPDSWEAVIIYEDSRNYPIISKPAVWINYVSGGTIPRLYFGTGGDDGAPDDATYSFIALLDAPTPEVEWYLGDYEILDLPEGKSIAVLSSGERVWADPKVADYIVYFSTLMGLMEDVDPTVNILGIGKLYARFVQTIAGSIIGGTAFATASGPQESIELAIKTRAAVTFGERERASDGTRKREVYIQEYDSTIQKLEQSIGALLKVKSWREVFRIIR